MTILQKLYTFDNHKIDYDETDIIHISDEALIVCIIKKAIRKVCQIRRIDRLEQAQRWIDMTHEALMSVYEQCPETVRTVRRAVEWSLLSYVFNQVQQNPDGHWHTSPLANREDSYEHLVGLGQLQPQAHTPSLIARPTETAAMFNLDHDKVGSASYWNKVEANVLLETAAHYQHDEVNWDEAEAATFQKLIGMRDRVHVNALKRYAKYLVLYVRNFTHEHIGQILGFEEPFEYYKFVIGANEVFEQIAHSHGTEVGDSDLLHYLQLQQDITAISNDGQKQVIIFPFGCLTVSKMQPGASWLATFQKVHKGVNGKRTTIRCSAGPVQELTYEKLVSTAIKFITRVRDKAGHEFVLSYFGQAAIDAIAAAV